MPHCMQPKVVASNSLSRYSMTKMKAQCHRVGRQKGCSENSRITNYTESTNITHLIYNVVKARTLTSAALITGS